MLYSFRYSRTAALRTKCPYSKLFWSAFFPHFFALGLNNGEIRSNLGLRRRNFQGIFSYENKHIRRFSNLHQCTFKSIEIYQFVFQQIDSCYIIYVYSISPYSVRMRENAGKNADQNNSEFGHFLRSVILAYLHLHDNAYISINYGNPYRTISQSNNTAFSRNHYLETKTKCIWF